MPVGCMPVGWVTALPLPFRGG